MTPVAKIVGLLCSNTDQLVGLKADNICAYKIDNENVDDKNVILVISEDSAGEQEYGNDNVISILRRITIQFYYPLDYNGDMALTEKTVKAFLFARNIRCYVDAGHIMSPDSQNIIQTLKFNYREREE